jgi:hypothetical protein
MITTRRVRFLLWRARRRRSAVREFTRRHLDWRSAGVCVLALGLASQVFQCRPARWAPSEDAAWPSEGEACRACEKPQFGSDADTALRDALCLTNSTRLSSTHSSMETLRITKQESGALSPGPKNPSRYRGWLSSLQSLTVQKSAGGCVALRSVRWGIEHAACEIEQARNIPLTDQECRDMFVCLRSAIPSGAAVSWCDQPGTDDSEFTVEVFDSDHGGACVWLEPPPCVSLAMARHSW